MNAIEEQPVALADEPAAGAQLDELEQMIAADDATNIDYDFSDLSSAKSSLPTGDQAPDSEHDADHESNAMTEETDDAPSGKPDTDPDPDDYNYGDEEPGIEEDDTLEEEIAGEVEELTKSDKDRQREARAWQKINAQKEELAAYEAQLAERAEQIQQQNPSYSPEQYESAALRFEANGQRDLAELAREQADRVRRDGPDGPSEQQREFAVNQARWWDETRATFPDLDNPHSEFANSVRGILQQEPQLLQIANGPYLVAQFIEHQRSASRLPDMAREIQSLRSRLNEYEELTSAPPDGSPAMPAPKSWNQMSISEQEQWLTAQSEENY